MTSHCCSSCPGEGFCICYGCSLLTAWYPSPWKVLTFEFKIKAQALGSRRQFAEGWAALYFCFPVLFSREETEQRLSIANTTLSCTHRHVFQNLGSFWWAPLRQRMENGSGVGCYRHGNICLWLSADLWGSLPQKEVTPSSGHLQSDLWSHLSGGTKVPIFGRKIKHTF